VRIGVLGPLDVRDQAGNPVEVGGRRLRALLIRLAVDAGRPVSSERLIDDLWPSDPPSAPGPALHTLIARLRTAGGRDLLEAVPGGYRLLVEPEQIDAFAFERQVVAAQALELPQDRAAELARALSLWRGAALADVADAEFAAPVIARLDELRLSATEDRIDAELALGPARHLVSELETLAAAHPTRERLRGQLMRALYAAGRQSAALAVYEDTRRELADGLGVDPSAELAEVHLAILRHEAGPARRRTNLPAPLTSFVGREEECRRIAKLLAEARLVTLTGPGGAGKTRLSAEVTGGLLDDYPDGVWFVPLAPVTTAVDVAQAVLQAIGVSDSLGSIESRELQSPLERLIDVLRNRRLLMIFDNCEHLVDAVARLADRVLGEAAGVRILATSREPLGITGETLYPVPSLPLPEADAEAEDAVQHAAVRLFADRARAVRPDFSLAGDQTALVIAICRELDGIPLAIELAAARVRSLTVRQIADRLGYRFQLLNGGNRAALPRHQTLRAVVDWSWDLLEPDERTVLRRLSVFTGGATPESAEQVCRLDDSEHRDARDVIDVIASLIDKSLVQADTGGDGEVRYRLLETVRAYGIERLEEAGEQDRVRAAHVTYFLDLAERAEPLLRRSEQLYWLDRMVTERGNCNAALQHTIDSRDVERGLRLVAALTWSWVMSDYEAEAGGWAVSIRALSPDGHPDGLQEAYAICVFMANLVVAMDKDQGPFQNGLTAAVQEAMQWVPQQPEHPMLCLAAPLAALATGSLEQAAEGLAVVAGHPDPWVRAVAHVCLGVLALNDGRVDASAVELTYGYQGFEEIGERWGMTIALASLAEISLIRGEGADAVRSAERAHANASLGVSPEQGGVMLILLGRAHAEAGDPDRGRPEIEEGVRHAERLGEFADAANGLLLLSRMAIAGGDRPAAWALAERARELVEPRIHRTGHAQPGALAYSRLGCLAELDGDLEASARWHEQAMRAIGYEQIVHNQSLASLLEGLAALAAARGENDRAAELLGAAETIHGYRDEQSLEVARAGATALAALGEPAYEQAYQRGRRTGRQLAAEQIAAAGEPGHSSASIA
jgi:predicted ATPase/DNA-binding SARP family transcriptional activator